MSVSGKRKIGRLSVIPAVLMSLVAGCGDMEFNPAKWFGRSGGPVPTTQPAGSEYASVDVPEPVNLLLPKSINIHHFTKTRMFDEAGGIGGVDVRIEMLNAFQEATKAFGDFRFELYSHRDHSIEPKDKICGVWEVKPSLLDPKENLRYWKRSQTMYEFKLQWDEPIPVGTKFVLVVVFTSPFTPRMTAQRVFISGQE